MRMKAMIVYLFFVGATVLLCFGISGPFPCSADDVWSDDFDDGDYDGWTVMFGGFAAADTALKATEDVHAHAAYTSSVATGTWSFDVNCSLRRANIHFVYDMSNRSYTIELGPISRAISIWYNQMVGQSFENLASLGTDWDLSGWIHIDVTRDADGRICVYVDGEFAGDVVHTAITTSENFVFCALGAGAALDNIVVSDTVDIEPPLPEAPFYMQTWFLATVGSAVILVVIGAVWMLRKGRRVSYRLST